MLEFILNKIYMKIIIHNLTQLRALFLPIKFSNLSKEFELNINGLNNIKNKKYETMLSKLTSESGCKSGKIYLILFSVLCIILHYIGIKIPTSNLIVNLFIYMLTGAFVGKLIGLSIVKFKIYKIILEIESSLNCTEHRL